MTHRFRFTRENKETLVVEGARVDVVGSRITVVDEYGHALASFVESDLTMWHQVHDGRPHAS